MEILFALKSSTNLNRLSRLFTVNQFVFKILKWYLAGPVNINVFYLA